VCTTLTSLIHTHTHTGRPKEAVHTRWCAPVCTSLTSLIHTHTHTQEDRRIVATSTHGVCSSVHTKAGNNAGAAFGSAAAFESRCTATADQPRHTRSVRTPQQQPCTQTTRARPHSRAQLNPARIPLSVSLTHTHCTAHGPCAHLAASGTVCVRCRGCVSVLHHCPPRGGKRTALWWPPSSTTHLALCIH